MVLVVGAGGYGITRGLIADSESACGPPADGFNIIQREVTTGERSQLWLGEYEWPSEEPGTSGIITYPDSSKQGVFTPDRKSVV